MAERQEDEDGRDELPRDSSDASPMELPPDVALTLEGSSRLRGVGAFGDACAESLTRRTGERTVDLEQYWSL